MNKSAIQTQIRDFVANGKTGRAIDLLIRATKGTDLETAALMQSSAFKKLKKDRNLGVLSHSDQSVREVQITSAVLELLDAWVGEAPLPPPTDNRPNLNAKPATPNHWIPAFIGLGLILIILGLLVFFPNPTPQQSTVFRIVLALAASGLAAIIPGFLRVDINNTVKAGGALAVFAFVYLFNPVGTTAGTTDFKIFLENQKGQVVLKNEGQLAYRIGTRSDALSINETGSITIEDIDANRMGEAIHLELRAKGWEFNEGSPSTQVKFAGESITLQIKPDNTYCCVSGRVLDANNHPILGARASIGNLQMETDSFGKFYLEIPEDLRAPKQKVTVEKTGYTRTSLTINPGDKRTEIFKLEKQ